MKLKTLILILLFSTVCWSQNVISYKSIIKDTSGNIISNTTIIIQFGILQESTLVYEESHSITTDQNGMIITNIGDGTLISGDFNLIDWGSANHYLNIKINYGSGLIDFGTTRFNHVPYAIIAENAKNVTGLEALDQGSGIGYRLTGMDNSLYGNIGKNAIDLSLSTTAGSNGAIDHGAIAIGVNSAASNQSTIAIGTASRSLKPLAISVGFRSMASENASIAIGDKAVSIASHAVSIGKQTVASGSNAFSIGNQTVASGLGALSFGALSESNGKWSTAIGYGLFATGDFSTAMGQNVSTKAYNSFALGRYNIGNGDSENWINTDPLFEIGNGTNYSNRSNALTVLKNGNIGIITNTPKTKLHISEGNDTGLGQNHNGYVLLGPTTAKNISLDSNEIMARNNGAAADLNLQIEGGRVLIGGKVGIGTTNPAELLHIDGGRMRIGTETIADIGLDQLAFNASLLPDVNNRMSLGNASLRWRGVWAIDGTINTSDRREKKNIKELNYGLSEVLQMNPVSFKWKDRNDQNTKLGLIAQDLLELVPEVVKTHTWETRSEDDTTLNKVELDRLGVYYSDLIPVLIKAIQEQNKEIEALKKVLKTQKSLEDRLLSIEEKINNAKEM